MPSTILKLASSHTLNPFEKASAPSPPLSPTSSQTPSGFSAFINTSSTHTLSSSSTYASIQAPIISMPMPYHIYDTTTTVNGVVGGGGGVSSSNSSSSGYAGGECSSASSMSTSSVSPAASSSSHSQSSPLQQQPSIRSSYLLTTAIINNNSSYLSEQPPFGSRILNTSGSHVENHYNNSNQSLSDGKLNIFFYFNN